MLLDHHNPPIRMVSIALMIILHKQFDNLARELIREKIDMVSHTRHHVYTRTKKWRRVIGKAMREKRGLDEFIIETIYVFGS